MTVTLVHLFPAELSTSGDSGNVQAVAYRLEQSGVAVDIVGWDGSSELPQGIDAIFIGNGPWSAAERVAPRLRTIAAQLLDLRDSGVPIFAAGVGAELLARTIIDSDGQSQTGVGVFAMTVHREADRRVGYMRVSTSFGELIGFGDFASQWHVDQDNQQLGNAVIGDRPSQVIAEGCIVHNSVATRLGGPAVPLNPVLAERIIKTISVNRGLAISSPPTVVDDYAKRARDLIIANIDSVFTTIAL